MTLGKKLQQARMIRGWSLDQLAAASGVCKMTLSNYEHDRHEPNFINVTCIADALGISLDYLAGRQKR